MSQHVYIRAAVTQIWLLIEVFTDVPGLQCFLMFCLNNSMLADSWALP